MVSFQPAQDFADAKHVRAQSLTPIQQPTPRSLQVGSDCYMQYMLKHAHGLSVFHSEAELLYAGLLEADPEVASFVPQPFRLRVRGRYYTPDCYLVAGAQRRVVELKPNARMDPHLQRPLAAFFATQGMTFEVISNEWVYERQVLAESWLEIVRRLHVARDEDTTEAELQLRSRLLAQPQLQVSDIVDAGDRDATYLAEVALYRLLHRGVLVANLETDHLNYATEVSLSP